VGYRYTNLLIKGYTWLACYPTTLQQRQLGLP